MKFRNLRIMQPSNKEENRTRTTRFIKPLTNSVNVKIYLSTNLCCQPSYLRAPLCDKSCHRIISKIQPFYDSSSYSKYILESTCNFNPCNITVASGVTAEHTRWLSYICFTHLMNNIISARAFITFLSFFKSAGACVQDCRLSL